MKNVKSSAQRKVKTAALIIGVHIFLASTFAMLTTANAAPFIQTGLDNLDSTGYQAGGNFISGFVQPPSNGISAFASASANGVDIALNGVTTTNPNITVTAGGVAMGHIAFSDVIFSDTNNPGNTGPINVSANMISSLTTTVLRNDCGPLGCGIFASGIFDVGVGLTQAPPSFAQTNMFSGSGGSNFTTSAVSVNLGTAYSFVFTANLEFLTNIFTEAAFEAELSLDSIAFNLPDGITVNSLDGGIVNNSIGPSIGVPEPGTVALFAVSALGLGAVRRRKKLA